MALLGAQPQTETTLPQSRQHCSLTANFCSFKDHGGEAVSFGEPSVPPPKSGQGGAVLFLQICGSPRVGRWLAVVKLLEAWTGFPL